MSPIKLRKKKKIIILMFVNNIRPAVAHLVENCEGKHLTKVGHNLWLSKGNYRIYQTKATWFIVTNIIFHLPFNFMSQKNEISLTFQPSRLQVQRNEDPTKSSRPVLHWQASLESWQWEGRRSGWHCWLLLPSCGARKSSRQISWFVSIIWAIRFQDGHKNVVVPVVCVW